MKLIAPSRCIPEGTTPSRCIPVDAYKYTSGVDAYKYASGVDAYEYASDKGTPLPGHLPVSGWIPTLPKLGRLLGFSQRILLPFSPIAIKAKNNLLS